MIEHRAGPVVEAAVLVFAALGGECSVESRRSISC